MSLTWIFFSTEFAFILAGEITQVIESIHWVRCASGNFYFILFLHLFCIYYIIAPPPYLLFLVRVATLTEWTAGFPDIQSNTL